MMDMKVENDYVDKIMLKFIRDTSKRPGKHEKVAVLSQSTNYPGAFGVHSEIGRIAHARNITADNELKSTVSAMESIHRKEINSLNFSKKNVEHSMVAYSQKMRRISSDKLFDRIKIHNDLENSRKWTSMSKLYDEAIQNVASEIKYTIPKGVNLGRSVSFSHGNKPVSVPSRKTSSHEQFVSVVKPETQTSDESKECYMNTKRSRRVATICAPDIIITDTSVVLPPLVSTDHILLETKHEPITKTPLSELADSECITSNLGTKGREPAKEELYAVKAFCSEIPELEVLPIENKTMETNIKSKKKSKKVKIRKPSRAKVFGNSNKEVEAGNSKVSPKERKTKTFVSEDNRPISDSNSLDEQNRLFEKKSRNRLKSECVESTTASPDEFNPHRRRSLSMPTSSRPPTLTKQKPLVDCNGNEIELKSVLRHRKTSDITYLVRKSVQFQLPELNKSHFDVYNSVKCEQSPTTITIISSD